MSKKFLIVGFSIHIPEIGFNFPSRLPGQIGICMAEIIAIKEAIVVIIKKNIRKALMLTDSKSAILNLNKIQINTKEGHLTSHTKSLLCMARKSEYDIRLISIPSHLQIIGNEVADTVAKIGRELNTPKRINWNSREILPEYKKNILSDFYKVLKNLPEQTERIFLNQQFPIYKNLVKRVRIHQQATYYFNQ